MIDFLCDVFMVMCFVAMVIMFFFCLFTGRWFVAWLVGLAIFAMFYAAVYIARHPEEEDR